VPKRTLVLALMLAALLPACGGECTTQPFAVLPIAHIGAPAAEPAAHGVAACPALVTYRGIEYEVAPSSGRWVDIGDDAVHEVGTASGSNTLIRDRRVYAIDGVPPEAAIAMRLNGQSGLTILTAYGSGFNPLLCPYLAQPLSACEDTSAPAATKAVP
jgi:hypothetical protein